MKASAVKAEMAEKAAVKAAVKAEKAEKVRDITTAF